MNRLALCFLVTFATVNIAWGQNWHTDFQDAKKIATKEKKIIVLVFQGSDWCGPCIKLDRDVWSTDAFTAYAKDHFIMVRADFPRKKTNALSPAQAAANAKLAETYNKRGIFPFVVVMDTMGKVLGETSYKKVSPEDYIAILNGFIQ